MKTTLQNDFLQARLERLKLLLESSGMHAFLIERPLDLFYYTGLRLSAGKLLVGRKESALFVDGRYFQVAKEKAAYPSFLDTQAEVIAFCKREHIAKVGFDGQHTSYDHASSLCRWEGLTFSPMSDFYKRMRSIKDAQEIAKMKKSAALLWEGFVHIQSLLKIGITEKALAKAFEIFCLQKGAEGLSFDPIIAFGANSSMPHYCSQEIVLKRGDPVLIDIGVVVDEYHSDMTRMLFYGDENISIKQLYEIAQRAQRAALELCRPGIAVKELDLAARQVMREEGVEELFVHSLGHGIGLETHEFPKVKWDGEDKDVILEKGMVFTIEPGLYSPGLGGVRYEDTILIADNGYENFYK